MYKYLIALLFVSLQIAEASNGWKSELSHLIGGLLMPLIIAFIVTKLSPKYASKGILIGFIVSITYVAIDQIMDYVKDGKFFDQLMDFGFHFLGSLITLIAAKRFKK